MHPASRAGLKLVVGVVAAVVLLALIAKALGFRRAESKPPVDAAPPSQTESLRMGNVFLPAIDLCVDASSMESAWIAALATRLGGQAEAPIPNGRVDVVTGTYAIEVERSAKWHEGIGQSLHYADATGLRPALAVILDEAGLATSYRQIEDADKIATKQGIKVVVLRSACKGQ